MANPRYNNQVTNSRACMAKGGSVKEYGGKEKYKSKAAMMKHEKKESKAMEKKEKMHRMPNGKMMKGAKHKAK